MAKVSQTNTSISVGVRNVNVLAFRSTISIGDVFARALRSVPAKAIAARLRKITSVSARTVESWKQARRTPHARHIMAMLTDDELSALLLQEVNPDLAHQAKVVAAKKKLRELEAK
jgi:hypothetical protein